MHHLRWRDVGLHSKTPFEHNSITSAPLLEIQLHLQIADNTNNKTYNCVLGIGLLKCTRGAIQPCPVYRQELLQHAKYVRYISPKHSISLHIYLAQFYVCKHEINNMEVDDVS